MEALWSFIGIVVLVAWFLGISYGAVLQGVANFVIWALVIGAVLCVAINLLIPTNTSVEAPAPKQRKNAKPPKEYPTLRKAVGWVAFFIASYLITDLIFIAMGLWETPHASWTQLVLAVLLPALPFSMVVAHKIIHKMLTKKHAQKRAR